MMISVGFLEKTIGKLRAIFRPLLMFRFTGHEKQQQQITETKVSRKNLKKQQFFYLVFSERISKIY